MLKNAISWDCQNNKEWSNRLPMTLLGLRAQPHLDSDLSPNQQAFGSELTPPPEFASRGTEELDEADFYVQLQKVRDGYAYPPTVHYKQNDGEASGALQKAKFVLVQQDGHNPLWLL